LALDGSASTTASRRRSEDPDPLLAPEQKWPVAFGKQPVAERKGSGDKQVWEVPELYVTGHNGARVLTAVMAIGIAAGVVLWILEARDRFDVPLLVCDGCAPPEWFRWTQLLLAVVGIAAALVVLVYMVNFTVREVVWRRWRGVSIIFGVLAAAWTVLWWLDYFWI
jgi:hypothetical protein